MLSGFIVGELLTLAALPAAFLAYYLGLVRFRSIPRPLESWYLIAVNVVLMQIFGLAVATSVFGLHWPGRNAVRAGVYFEVIVILLAQLALAIAARHEITRKDRKR